MNTDSLEPENLRLAMNWVIPADSTPGAGTDVGVKHLCDLVTSLGGNMVETYRQLLPRLEEGDLGDRTNGFAQMFIDHVRDVYYGYLDTGAWDDIGFSPLG